MRARSPEQHLLAVATLASVILAALVLGAAPVSAQVASTDIRQCFDIADDAARIRCYDNVARALNGQAPLPPLYQAPTLYPETQAPAAAGTQPVASSADTGDDQVVTFGLPRARVDGLGEDAVLYDRIAELDKSGFGDYVVTLESGQVWKQTSAQEYHLREGQEVSIRSTSWGSDYRLHADGVPGHIQVTRVQ